MTQLRKPTRSRRWGDSGFTLIEVLIAMGIFSVLISVTFTLFIQIMNQSKDTIARTRALQEARLGISQIDRQVRSGNVILDPATEDLSTSGVGPYYSMRIFTQVDGKERCAQWRVIDKDGDGFGNLEFRSWAPGYPGVVDVTDWGPVAHNIVEMDSTPPTSESQIVADQPSTWPPFWVDTEMTAGTQAQLVRVTLRLKDPQERGDTDPTLVTTVITGRNTIFGYPASSCSQAPPP